MTSTKSGGERLICIQWLLWHHFYYVDAGWGSENRQNLLDIIYGWPQRGKLQSYYIQNIQVKFWTYTSRPIQTLAEWQFAIPWSYIIERLMTWFCCFLAGNKKSWIHCFVTDNAVTPVVKHMRCSHCRNQGVCQMGMISPKWQGIKEIISIHS